jgi:hypothetical protein
MMHPSHILQSGHRTNKKECIIKEPSLERYLAFIRRMENFFKGFTVEHIDRNKNSEAN